MTSRVAFRLAFNADKPPPEITCSGCGETELQAGLAVKPEAITQKRGSDGEMLSTVDTSAAKPLCERCTKLLTARKGGEAMAVFWVSFTRDGKPLGAAIIEADDTANDLAVAQQVIDAGHYPGGDITVRRIHDADVPERYRNKLLSVAEAAAFIEGRAS